MNKRFSRCLSVLLSLLLIFQTFQPTLAIWQADSRTAAEASEEVTVTDENGTPVRADETWEETYPYGAFAFDVSSAGIREGEDAVITVYRLGGTKGRATAYINYNPTVVLSEDESPYYGYALSADDITLEVEEPLPVAKYQAVGAPEPPEHSDADVLLESDADGYVLTLDGAADSWQWQILYGDSWNDIDDATEAELLLDAEYIDSDHLDFRCIYTQNGKTFCTDSLNGAEYEKPTAEVPEPTPEGLDLNAEPTYTALALADGNDVFAAWVFSLTFADGEWKKELHIRAHEDGIPEALESATLRIVKTEGGEIYEAADSLIFHVEDIDESAPSTLGFTAQVLSVDKADGKAEILVRREGGCERPVSVDVQTADGTAAAGEDYVRTAGTLLFYGNVTELAVTIELIDDGQRSDDPVDFSVLLTNLKGDGNCTLTQDCLTVSLTNSGTGDRSNPASVLHDTEAVDLTEAVTESPTSANANAAAAVGRQLEIEEEPMLLSLIPITDGEMATQSHQFGNLALIDFTSASIREEYWNKYAPNYKNYKDSNKKPRTDIGDRFKVTGDGTLGGIEATKWKTEGISYDENLTLYGSGSATAEFIADHYKPETAGQMFYQVAISGWIFADADYTSIGLKYTRNGKTQYATFSPAADHGGAFAVGSNLNIKMGDSLSLCLAYEGVGTSCAIALTNFQLYRRAFAADAFTVEISTPNDADTGCTDGAAAITDYGGFMPTVSFVYGGAAKDTTKYKDNSVYVGSKLQFSSPGLKGYSIKDVLVFQSKDDGNNWVEFTKFGKETNTKDGTVNIALVGTKENHLDEADLAAQYRFRVVYERSNGISVDLTPSLPRDENGTVLTDANAIAQLFTPDANGKYYNGKEDHGFGSARITFGYTEWDDTTGDYSTKVTETAAFITPKASEVAAGTTSWIPESALVNNLQWICFNLPKEDLLVFNGKAYAGNEKIWLTESDLTTDLVIGYYHSAYQGNLNPMTTTILWKELWWDADGDGKISAHLNEGTGQYEPDTDSKDMFIQTLSDGDSLSSDMIAPEKNSDGVYCQYFIQLCYTMTPRCLTVPAGGSSTDRAQILTAFTSAINPGSGAYSKQTTQERMYTYVVSGLDGEGNYTADGHIMYGAEASAKTVLSIPLGGDRKPPQLNADETAYTWTPDWIDNSLYPYRNPDPITLTQTLVGDADAASGYTFHADALRYEWTADGLKQINGYLSAMTGTRTFVLVSQQQTRSTAEILADKDYGSLSTQDTAAAGGVTPGSTTVGGISTSPSALGLSQLSDGDHPTGEINSGGEGGKSALPEFEFPFNLTLPSMELEVTDYVTIIYEENQIGFSVSVPLGEISKETGDADYKGKGGWNEAEKKHPGIANKEAWTKFSDFFKDGAGSDNTYKAAKNYKDAGYGDPAATVTSQKVSVGFTINFGFMFEYNPLDNDFVYKEFKGYFAVEVNYRVQARLTVCPLLYGFIDVTFELDVGSGKTYERQGEEAETTIIPGKVGNKKIPSKTLTYYPTPTSIDILTDAAYQALAPADQALYLKVSGGWAKKDEYFARKSYYLTSEQYDRLDASEQSNYYESGGYYVSQSWKSLSAAQAKLTEESTFSFETDKKAFSIQFSGKLYVEPQVMVDGEWKAADEKTGLISGTITSDGTTPTQVILIRQDDMKLDETIRVKLYALDYDSNVPTETTTITRIVEYKSVCTCVHWNGISIDPSLAIEIGVGIGVEVLKAELYFHLSFEAAFTLGCYNSKYDPSLSKEDPHYENKYLPGSVDEFEACFGIAARVVVLFFTYEMDFVNYTISYDGESWEYGFHFLNDMVGGDADAGDLGITVRVPRIAATEQRIYSPQDNAESELATQALDPADTNVPFQFSDHGGAADAAALNESIPEGSQYQVVRVGDENYLVYTVAISGTEAEDSTQLVLSRLAYDTVSGKYGLLNPVDETSDVRYIPVDGDKTGDLDFDVWADGSGGIRAAWVSYASPAVVSASPTVPSIPAYTDAATGTVMTADNYRELSAPQDSDDSYTQWKTYYEELSSYNTQLQNRAKAAGDNTVVKTSGWAPGSAGFTEPEILCGKTGSYVFLPASDGNGNAVFFGSTLTKDRGDAYEAYAAYEDGKTNLPAQILNYQKAVQLSRLNLFGTQSALNLAVRGESGDWVIHQTALDPGETLANLEFISAGDSSYYVAYTTETTLYTAGDMITVYRLYLRQVTATGDWGDAYLIRQLWDYDQNTGRDGVYSGGSCTAEYDSPYLSNLRFLTANLDADMLTGGESALSVQDVALQTILLFEMNGSSYVIPEAQLTAITSGSGGILYPFFTPAEYINTDGEPDTETASGKLQVDINSDPNGNLYAVYVGTAPGTAGTAIYRSAYDAELNSWGNGVMLAMHDMNVREAAAANGWDQSTEELAYLYRNAGIRANETALTALYGEDALKTVKQEDAETLGDGKAFRFSQLQTTTGSDGDLLIIAQGTLQEMEIASYTESGETHYVLTPKYDSDGAMDTMLGTYAISYSHGKQALGNGRITFAQKDFGMGSELYVEVSADNVGDTAFRGSADRPVVATLQAGGQLLAKWAIADNVISGQTVEFGGYCQVLKENLKKGDRFTLTLAEDEAYGSGRAVQNLDLFTLEEKADLSVDGLSIRPERLSQNGQEITLAVSFTAANYGSAAASGVYAQFTYENANGDSVLLPLTASTLTAAEAQPLMTTQAYTTNLSLGSIPTGNGVKVSGTITVPSDVFAAGESAHASIGVELFSDADTVTSAVAGVNTAIHNEYYSSNNLSTQSLEAYTAITAAHSVVIPLGTTTRIPLSAVSSRGTQPVLTVQELDDADGRNLGILNFRKNSGRDGLTEGILTLTPTSAGTGIIHVSDTETNSTYAIAFEVTDSSEGIDIYSDNSSFTFSDGWRFFGFETWGTGTAEETPLRQNLSVGSKNAAFTFETVAESIDLYFQGEISVTVGTGAAQTFTNTTGGSVPTMIGLGENPDTKTRTVTVTVLSDQAKFDRLVESYTGNVVPVPDYDGESPLFIWSRSFPDTGSVSSGSIPLKVYVTDNNGLAGLSVNSETLTPQLSGQLKDLSGSDLLWCYDFGALSANARYTLTATDLSGNQTSTALDVDWFLASSAADPTGAEIPRYTAEFRLGDDPLAAGAFIAAADAGRLKLRFTEDADNLKKENNTSQIYYFDGSSFQPVLADPGTGAFPVTANGAYWARTVNSDGSWSAQVLWMDRLDSSVAQVTLNVNEATGKLEWTAAKSSNAASVARITGITINGYPVYSDTNGSVSLSGSLPIRYSGEYVLTATDSAGNTASATCSAVFALEGGAVSATSAWDQACSNGTVTLDASDMTGGTYSAAGSTPASNVYGGDRYEAAILTGTASLNTAGIEWKAIPDTDKTLTWKDLRPGTYTVAIRDAGNPENYITLGAFVEDQVLTASAVSLNASGSAAEDGKLIITTKGGTTTLAAFAVFPVKDVPDGTDLADYVRSDAVTWTVGDANKACTLLLPAGEYGVAARNVYVTETAAAELLRLADSLAQAETALKAAEEAVQSDPQNADKKAALETAQTDYDTAKETYDRAAAGIAESSAAAYQQEPAYWSGVCLIESAVVEADPDPVYPPASNLQDIGVNDNGSVVFTLKPGKQLTASDQEKIRKVNAAGDTVVVADGLTVMIPEGVLTSPDFDLNRLLADVSEAREGMIVAYTTPDGTTATDAFGIVSDGSASYIVIAEGDYRIEKATASFGDIAGLWGEENILFAAYRGLVNGTGNDLFSPDLTMSRAMFVTVLWRLTASPKADVSAITFTDLTADWYREAVAWAVENGIVNGYSADSFGPDDPVTREQMCVLMTRYLAVLGWTLEKTGPAIRFDDAAQISDWATEAVGDCTQIGLINGVGDNLMAPQNNATRMEATTILTRFIKAIVRQYCG